MFVTFSWLGTHSYVWPAADWLSKVTVLLRTFQKVSKSLTVSRWLWRIITDLSCCLTFDGEKFLHAKAILMHQWKCQYKQISKICIFLKRLNLFCKREEAYEEPTQDISGWAVKDWDEGTKIRIPAQIRNTKQKHRTLFSLRL